MKERDDERGYQARSAPGAAGYARPSRPTTPSGRGTERGAARNLDAVAEEAYAFGYPLVLMDVTRQVSTAPRPEALAAPPNRFVHVREFPDASFTSVVSPNNDTLYSAAWLDLSREPVVLSVPDTGGRYYLMPMLDGWTNVFASPGSRTTGNGEGHFAVTGPRWNGSLPADVREIRAPTEMVWIIGRTQTDGKRDYPAVHAIQDGFRLTPLSGWGRPYTPPEDVPVRGGVDRTTAPVDQVARMDAATFFGRLNELMVGNPPAPADADAMERFAAVGVKPGAPFDPARLDPAARAAVERAPAAVLEKLKRAATPEPAPGNEWDVKRGLGRYGTDYGKRALVALVGLGANLTEDALYPRAVADADGEPLTGANRYVLHFEPGETPPARAFWSVTMYDTRQFLVDNPIDRYAIGDRDALKINPDGSLDILIQHDSPGKERESNWLPAPEGPFNLILRLYWPEVRAVDGTWQPPGVRRVG